MGSSKKKIMEGKWDLQIMIKVDLHQF
jgi:hypothetical protein